MVFGSLAIIVDDAHVAETDAIAKSLVSDGVQVRRVIPQAGAIYATTPIDSMSSLAAKLRRIEGIAEVRPEGRVQLPPVDALVPQ